MKKVRLVRLYSVIALMALLCGLSVVSACAQTPVLIVRSLQDTGGLDRGLNTRLTMALSRFLSDHSEKAFQVTSGKSAVSAPVSNISAARFTRYTLEGELGCATGRGEENARFLLVTRLYREDTSRVLLGQWVGTSNSLRLLTTNLRNDPRFHTLGLVGEMGSRIVTLLAADQSSIARQWNALWPRLSARNAAVEIVTAGEKENKEDKEAQGKKEAAEDRGGNKPRPLRQVPSDMPFRVRLRGPSGARAYLLVSDVYGALHALRLSAASEELRAEGIQPVLSAPVTLPDAVTDVWAVCRIPSAPAAPHASTRQRTRSRTCNTGDEAGVIVLDGVGSSSVPLPEAFLTRLLADIAHEPQSWRVTRMRLAEHKSLSH